MGRWQTLDRNVRPVDFSFPHPADFCQRSASGSACRLISDRLADLDHDETAALAFAVGVAGRGRAGVGDPDPLFPRPRESMGHGARRGMVARLDPDSDRGRRHFFLQSDGGQRRDGGGPPMVECRDAQPDRAIIDHWLGVSIPDRGRQRVWHPGCLGGSVVGGIRISGVASGGVLFDSR